MAKNLLTIEEEKKYGKDLQLVHASSLVYFEQRRPMLNLKKIFSILANYDYDEKLLLELSKLNSLLDTHGNKILTRYIELAKEQHCFLKSKSKNENLMNKEDFYNQLNILKTYLNARDIFFKSNLNLVWNVANKKMQNNNNLDMEELYADGCIGLLEAINYFDVKREVKFSTYAVHWMNKTMDRESRKKAYAVYFPEFIIYRFSHMKNKITREEEKLGRELSSNEIMQLFDISYDDYFYYLNWLQTSLYLDQPVQDDTDMTLQDMFMIDNCHLEKVVMNKLARDDIEKLISTLSKKEQFIIKNRIGMNDNQEIITLKNLGEMLNHGAPYILGLEQKIVDKLRKEVLKKNKYGDLRLYLRK